MNVCLLTKCTCTVKHCIQSHKIEVNAFESEKILVNIIAVLELKNQYSTVPLQVTVLELS